MRKASASGLTLVEVLIALVVLGVGVMAAAQLQAVSLRFTSQADAIKTATQLSRGELEWRRQTEVHMGTNLPCQSAVPEGYDCFVDVEPCNAAGASLDLTCAPGLVNPVAYRLAVTVESPRVERFTLSTITTGTYVTGVIGTGEIGTVPSPPDDSEDPGDDDPVPCIRWHPNQEGRCLEWGN